MPRMSPKNKLSGLKWHQCHWLETLIPTEDLNSLTPSPDSCTNLCPRHQVESRGEDEGMGQLQMQASTCNTDYALKERVSIRRKCTTCLGEIHMPNRTLYSVSFHSPSSPPSSFLLIFSTISVMSSQRSKAVILENFFN